MVHMSRAGTTRSVTGQAMSSNGLLGGQRKNCMPTRVSTCAPLRSALYLVLGITAPSVLTRWMESKLISHGIEG